MQADTPLSLRVFPVDEFAIPSETSYVPRGFENLLKQLERLSGWVYRFDQPGAGRKPSAAMRCRLNDMSERVTRDWPALDRKTCEQIANEISEIASELDTLRQEWAAVQSALATQVIQQVQSTDSQRLDKLLNQLLETALDLTGFDSAGVFVLDREPGRLIQRTSTGVHFRDRHGTVRHASECRADLEALAGHVVTLSKQADTMLWNSPVPCRSAICLPVSSLDNLIGTIWLVSDRRKSVNDQQCNLLEVIAGRIAAELERMAMVTRFVTDQKNEECGNESEYEACETALPFEGWQVESHQVRFGADRAEGPRSIYRLNRDEQLAFLAYDFRGNQALGQRRRLLTTFEGLMHVSAEPAEITEALRMALGQHFDALEIESLACLLLDPLTGQLRFDLMGEFLISQPLPLADFCEPMTADRLVLDRDARELYVPRNSGIFLHHPVYDLSEFKVALLRRS